MSTTESGKKGNTLNLIVRYAASPPFKDGSAEADETLSSVKKRAMDAFRLTDEGAAADGNVIAYKLYHGRDEQTDLTRTLGTLAGHAGAVELKLSQHVQQGRAVGP